MTVYSCEQCSLDSIKDGDYFSLDVPAIDADVSVYQRSGESYVSVRNDVRTGGSWAALEFHQQQEAMVDRFPKVYRIVRAYISTVCHPHGGH